MLPPSDRSPSDRSPSDRSPSDRSPSDRSPSDRSPSDRSPSDRLTAPAGEVYDWYIRGVRLLDDGNPAAAAQLLAHAAAAEPSSRSIREALGRARLGSRQWGQARAEFEHLVAVGPDDDYARFGLGLAAARLGDLGAAAEQLALACAMRPEREDYRRTLDQVRATMRFRGVPQ